MLTPAARLPVLAAAEIYGALLNKVRDNGRSLHSSAFRLNVSTFCGIRWVHDFPPVY
jgi:hypothetical protein